VGFSAIEAKKKTLAEQIEQESQNTELNLDPEQVNFFLLVDHFNICL